MKELGPFETVEVLLSWFTTVRDGVNAGSSGDGPSWLHMHKWWRQGSFRELEAFLADMRRCRLDRVWEGYPVIRLRDDVDRWYIDVRKRSAPVLRPVLKSGCVVGHVPTGLFAPETVRDPRADRSRAEAGVRFLVDQFERRGLRPRLPVELWRIVTNAPEKAA